MGHSSHRTEPPTGCTSTVPQGTSTVPPFHGRPRSPATPRPRSYCLNGTAVVTVANAHTAALRPSRFCVVDTLAVPNYTCHSPFAVTIHSPHPSPHTPFIPKYTPHRRIPTLARAHTRPQRRSVHLGPPQDTRAPTQDRRCAHKGSASCTKMYTGRHERSGTAHVDSGTGGRYSDARWHVQCSDVHGVQLW